MTKVKRKTKADDAKKGTGILSNERLMGENTFAEYRDELKTLFSILPRQSFAEDSLEIKLKTHSRDGKLRITWKVKTTDRLTQTNQVLHLIHFLLEQYLLMPKIKELNIVADTPVYLGTINEIAGLLDFEECVGVVQRAMLMFAGGEYSLKLQTHTRWSREVIKLYEVYFEPNEEQGNTDDLKVYWTPNEYYRKMLLNSPITITEHKKKHSLLTVADDDISDLFPPISGRWLELLNFWRQGTTENEFFIDYKTLCQWMPINALEDKDSIIRQLKYIHKPIFANGLLVDFSLIPKNEKRTNWILKYQFAAE